VNKATVVTAYLALGANRGDRAANLRLACDLLDDVPGIEIVAKSSIYESQSVEGGGEGNFLNAAIRIETTLEPLELLAAIQAVEARLGRPQPHTAGARPIDIDILLHGEVTMQKPELTLPHPRMLNRQFVLRPLCDVLEGGWVRLAPEQWL
jgi:2-amino-4-hydroxy-6-hydroxymethyldihydropteridine diphosphokinase